MKYAIILTLIVLHYEFSAQCTMHNANARGAVSENLTQYESTGNSGLDLLFANQVKLVLTIFSLDAVDMYFYDDWRSYNAQAVDKPFGIDIVTFGLGMIRSKRREFAQRPDQACIALVAHEMAHVKQFACDRGVSRLPDWKQELHADFLSGYYMGYKWRIELATEAEAETFFDLFFSIGDNAFSSPGHHGTPAQRKRAAMKGWHYGKLLTPILKAYDDGIDFVSQFSLGG